MSDFSEFFAVEPAQYGKWRLTADMPFELIYGAPITRIIVPRGFQSDGPTIPALARVLFNPADARYMKAAIIHDWMLEQRDGLGFRLYSPRQCADAFRDALRAADVAAWQIYVMWIAVLIWTSRKG